MIYLYESGINVLKNRIESNKSEVRWNNYNAVFWEKNSSGYFSKDGEYRKNSWGISKTFSINNNGMWCLPLRYVKYFK